MKVLGTLWGLLVDDGRLAWTLMGFLILSAIVSLFVHLPSVGALLIWLGLISSLVFSIEHQLRMKKKGK